MRDEALPAAHIGAEVVTRGLEGCLDSLASLLSSVDLDTLQAHYHRVFGHVSVPDCPTYESAYMGSNLFQQVQVMSDVAGFYRAFGFEVSDTYRERVDQLAVEMEFMHVLAYKEAFALVHHSRDKVAICRRGQRRFWGDHLGRWLAPLARLLKDKAGEGFYGELALVLAAFAEFEAVILGKALQLRPAKLGEQASGADMECPWADEGCAVAPP
jgi:TorA maturation chaperone TorD